MENRKNIIYSKSLNFKSRVKDSKIEKAYEKFNMTNGKKQYNFEFSKEYFD